MPVVPAAARARAGEALPARAGPTLAPSVSGRATTVTRSATAVASRPTSWLLTTRPTADLQTQGPGLGHLGRPRDFARRSLQVCPGSARQDLGLPGFCPTGSRLPRRR